MTAESHSAAKNIDSTYTVNVAKLLIGKTYQVGVIFTKRLFDSPYNVIRVLFSRGGNFREKTIS